MSVSVTGVKWWKENESWIELKSGLTVHVIQVGKNSHMKNQEKGEKSEQEVRPAIVLCHGWPDFSYTFRHQMKALDEAGFRAIALDQRGFGFSFATKPGNFTDRPKYQLQFICQGSSFYPSPFLPFFLSLLSSLSSFSLSSFPFFSASLSTFVWV